jgi:PAS domain S-box-containing protein
MKNNKPKYKDLEKKLADAEKLIARLEKSKKITTSEENNITIQETQDIAEAYISSEQNFKNTMDASPLGIRVITEDGDLIYANKAILDICGYKTSQELAAVPRDKLYSPESYKAHLERRRKRKLKEYVPLEYEIDIVRPNGEVRNLQVYRRGVMWSGEQQFMAMYQDNTEHKRAEVALKESEERFHSIVEHGNDGIVFIVNGLLKYCNSKLLEMVNYTQGELLGKSFIDFIAPEHKEMVADIYRRRIAGKKVQERYELNLLTKDGRKLYTEISATLINIKQEPVDIAIIRDITERKKVEEQLADEEVRRRILIEQSRDGIVILDQNGKVHDSNQKFANMVGYTMEEMKQLHVFDWEFLYPRERVVEMIRTVDEKGDHFETQHRRKDGTIYDVEISTNGAVFAGQKLVFCVCRDITERKRMEKALRESEEKFSKAFVSSPAIVAITTLKEGKFVEVNDSYIQTTGYSREEVIGKDTKSLNAWANPRDRIRMLRILKEKGKVAKEEFNFHMKSGEIRTWLFSAEPLVFGGEECLMGVSVDITERKQMEKTLEESEAKYHSIYENSPDAIFLTHPDGRILAANAAARKMFGKTEEQLCKEGRVGIVDITDPRLAKALDIRRKTGEFVGEITFLRADGTKFPGYLSSKVFLDKDGKQKTSLIVHDITERKRMEEALRESEVRYRSIVEQALVGIGISKGNQVTFANKALLRIFNYDNLEEFAKIPLLKHVAPSSRDFISERMKKMVKGEPISPEFEYDILCKGGAIKTLLANSTHVMSGGEVYTHTIFQDITERKKTEQAIQESEERFRTLFETMVQGVIYHDSEGRVISANPAAQRILGLTLDNMLGKTSLNPSRRRLREDGSLLPSEEHPSIVALRTGKPVNNVTMALFNSVDNDYRWVITSAIPEFKEGEKKPYRVYTTFTDITERKKAEQRINYLNQTLRSIRNVNQLITREKDRDKLLKSVCDTLVESRSFYMTWIVLFDESRNVITYAQSDVPDNVSPIGDTIKKGNLPLCVKKALKKSRVVIVEDPNKCVDCQMVDKSLNYGALSVRLEYASNIYGVLCSSIPREILADENEVSLFQEVGADIAFALYNMEREAEYQSLEQERLRTAKLESIGTLAGGIAHDFNNLLTGIMGNIGMVKTNISPSDATFEMLNEAEKAAIRAKELTQQLLTFARGGKPVKKSVNIAAIIKESAAFALRGSKAKLELSLPDDLWTIEADEGQISQVINNLVINADEAMPGGGTLKIQAKNLNLKKNNVPPLPVGDYVRIDIADIGIGISPEHLQRIFEPYFTTKQRGSGLGLTTAYSIVRNHGGTIHAVSKLNKGSAFHIYLPAAKKPTKGGKIMKAVSGGQAGGKVLVMDDEEIIRKMLKNMLSLAGYAVELSADGAEALEKYKEAKKIGDPFNAVIMDLTIPGGMGGREAVQKLLEIDPQAKVIVSSGYATDPIMSEYSKYGFQAVIAKPYSVKQLQETLSGLLTRKKK